MAKAKYRLRNLIYQYKMKGVKVITYYHLDDLNKMLFKVRDALCTLHKAKLSSGKTVMMGSGFALRHREELKELKHHLEIRILEKTILANKNGD